MDFPGFMNRVCKFVGQQTCALCDNVVNWHIEVAGRKITAEKKKQRCNYTSALNPHTMPDEEYQLYVLEMMAERLNWMALRIIKNKPLRS